VSNRPYLESDSMMPEHRRPMTETLQMSINRALMDRLDLLEGAVARLKKKVSDLEGGITA
jgi:hypothetical protein